MVRPKLEPLTSPVIHVTSDERSRNYTWGEDRKHEKLDPKVKIISVDDLSRYSGQVYFPKDTAEGSVLVRHPFEPDTYINANDAATSIKQSKFFKISEIAQLLGALNYEIDAIWEEVSERKLDAGGKVSYKAVKAETNIMNEVRQSDNMQFALQATYDGVRAISQESLAEAERRARMYGLWEDGAISSLIRQRDPKCENFNADIRYCFELTSEINTLLDAAFSLNVMDDVFSLDASAKRAMSRREKIRVRMIFKFPGKE